MKELSIENKAKRYDEALEKATALYKAAEPMSGCNVLLETIFPQLKEPEDKRIRKALIKLVKKAGEGYENVIDGVSVENAIAWLEKQGEQETLCDKCRKAQPSHSCQDITALGRCALEKQGEQKPVTIDIDKMVDVYRNTDEYDEDGNLKGKPVNCMIRAYEQGLNDAIEKVVLKPAWSEEDEKMLDDIIEASTHHCYLNITDINWLKSLKDRVLSQQKQEWSDEDEEMIDSIIGNIKYLYNIGSCDNATVDKKVNWLKSLTNRALPQPKREWSEEDEKMRAAVLQLITDSEKENCWNCVYCNDKEIYFSDIISWLKSFRPQNNITDEELAQAKKNAYNDVLDKIEYHSGEPTFDDGWNAAIDFVRKKSLRPRKQCCNDIPSREYILNVWELGNYWKELTNGVCSTEYGTELEYIQKHWKEGGYYDKISACPQKQWKPSDEQMFALEFVLDNHAFANANNREQIQLLYNDLKKLREEFTFC